MCGCNSMSLDTMPARKWSNLHLVSAEETLARDVDLKGVVDLSRSSWVDGRV